jgi:HAD superfamily hydrolase (TIGR01509 family)
MYDVLESFPNRKILLTGARDEDIERYGLDHVPYEYFTLKSDPKKSDPKYYELMLTHFGFKPDEVIYFEHNDDAMKSAQSVGIKTYYYDQGKKDLKALENFLTQNL